MEGMRSLCQDAFERGFVGVKADMHETMDKDHGRTERRQYWIIEAKGLADAKGWTKLKSVGLCRRERTVKGKTTSEEVFFATSLEIDSRQFATAVRNHWQVENGLHRSLDVTFREDHQGYKNKTMAQNFSCLRKIVLNILKKDPRKGSLKTKRLRAAGRADYRDAIIKNYV